MTINLERDTYRIPGAGMAPVKEANTEGWYGLGASKKALVWHYGRRWFATKGPIAHVPAVMVYCEEGWGDGQGDADLVWHGPFSFPRHQDFGGGGVCESCFKWWSNQKGKQGDKNVGE